MVDRSDDASCFLGLEGLAVERVVRTELGVKVVQLVTDTEPGGSPPGSTAATLTDLDRATWG